MTSTSLVIYEQHTLNRILVNFDKELCLCEKFIYTHDFETFIKDYEKKSPKHDRIFFLFVNGIIDEQLVEYFEQKQQPTTYLVNKLWSERWASMASANKNLYVKFEEILQFFDNLQDEYQCMLIDYLECFNDDAQFVNEFNSEFTTRNAQILRIIRNSSGSNDYEEQNIFRIDRILFCLCQTPSYALFLKLLQQVNVYNTDYIIIVTLSLKHCVQKFTVLNVKTCKFKTITRKNEFDLISVFNIFTPNTHKISPLFFKSLE